MLIIILTVASSKTFFLLSNNYASLDIIVKQKAGYGQRINMYKRKNPLAMSFIPTAKGLIFTVIVYQKLFKLNFYNCIFK